MSSASACGLAWPLGRTRAHAVSSLASRASRVLPHTRRTGSWRPGGLLRRPGWAVVSSEARHRRLRCVHRRRYAISNVADPRRGRRVVRADRSMFPKLCSYDNQDDLKQLRGRASRRDWAFCPVAFASGLSETSHGWGARLEGFAGLVHFASPAAACASLFCTPPRPPLRRPRNEPVLPDAQQPSPWHAQRKLASAIAASHR